MRAMWFANVRVLSDIVESYGKSNVRKLPGTKDEKGAESYKLVNIAAPATGKPVFKGTAEFRFHPFGMPFGGRPRLCAAMRKGALGPP